MASAVNTTVTELPESRVNVEVEVPPEEVQRTLESQARRLGREMKVPGFRTGKIPPAIVIQRLGRGAILDEAVRTRLTDWYLSAIQDSGITPVGDPQVNLGELPGEGKALTFSFEIGVRPTAKLATYRGVEVVRREPAADPEAIDAQIEQLRERFARLETVDRSAEEGDFVTVDFVGRIDGEPFPGGEGRDQLIELGAGQVIPGFEEGLVGAAAGEQRTVPAWFPDDYNAEHLAGKQAEFLVTVKEVKHKELPPLDDDFASDAAGYETLEELRESIAQELLERDAEQVENEFRAAALDAVVEQAEIEVPDALVEARAHELLERMMHALSHQGIAKEHYFAISGKTEEQLAEETKPDADQALRREAVLAAIIEAEGIEPSDEQLLDALKGPAERENTTPTKLLDRLRQNGRVGSLASDVAAEQALELVVREAKPISPDKAGKRGGAAAKGTGGASPKKKAAAEKRSAAAKPEPADELWTPDAEKPAGESGKLWTPGS
jgi:trigger factor